MTIMTSTTNVAEPEKTAEEMLRAIDELIEQPRLAGSLCGFPVYVSGRMPDQVVEIRSPQQTVRFRLDHPYIQGTKLHRDLKG